MFNTNPRTVTPNISPLTTNSIRRLCFSQRVIDQKFRDVGLQQTESGGGDAGQKHEDQARPVGDDETQGAPITIKRNAAVLHEPLC